MTKACSKVVNSVVETGKNACTGVRNCVVDTVNTVITTVEEIKEKIKQMSKDEIKKQIKLIKEDIISLITEINKLLNDNIKNAIKLLFFTKKYEHNIDIWNYLT